MMLFIDCDPVLSFRFSIKFPGVDTGPLFDGNSPFEILHGVLMVYADEIRALANAFCPQRRSYLLLKWHCHLRSCWMVHGWREA